MRRMQKLTFSSAPSCLRKVANITIVKRYFSRHRKRCMLTANNPVASIPTVLLEVPLLSSYSEGFKKKFFKSSGMIALVNCAGRMRTFC